MGEAVHSIGHCGGWGQSLGSDKGAPAQAESCARALCQARLRRRYRRLVARERLQPAVLIALSMPPVPSNTLPPSPEGERTPGFGADRPLQQRPRWQQWLRNFLPAPVGINGRERLRVAVGVALGMLLAGLLSRWYAQAGSLPLWMVPSLGASAVLVFGIPSSPLSQPWPVLAGNTVSVLVGAACAAWVPHPAAAAALAVALAVVAMVPLRCLHPPGASLALLLVLNQEQGVQLAAFPVLFTGLVLVVAGVVYNTLTGRSYPHPQRVDTGTGAAVAPGRFTSGDLDTALAQYNEVLDISRADLEGLLHLAGRAAFQRTLGELRCADIMAKPPFAVEPAVSLKDAWALMRREQIKALPVVDALHCVVGIVTVADFMRLAHLEVHEGLGKRLRTLVMGRGEPKTVREIMSTQVQVAQDTHHVMDLVPLFSHGGHHHIPIVDGQEHLVGIITQTDLVRTLATTVQVPNA